MTKKKLILIFGSMCSGKSTLIKLFQKDEPKFFHASMDNIKWFISDYSTEKYAKLGSVNKILFAMNKQAIIEGFSLIVEGGVGLIKNLKYYEELAEKNNMFLIKINMEAPYSLLLKRFTTRVENARKKLIKVSITDENIFLSRFNTFNKYKDKNLPSINSSQLDKEEMLFKLKNIIDSIILK
jgi:predicted kinase